jgi:hypothetical protein
MIKAVIDILGPCADVPVGLPARRGSFPGHRADRRDWPIWKDLGRDVLQRHIAGNAETFLRLA